VTISTGGKMTDRLVPKQTYSSPISYVGATRRLLVWMRRPGWWRRPIGWLALVVAWTLLTVYYTGLFLVLWPVVIPFRLFRRHQRKSLAVQRAQLEEMRRLTAGPPTG
jgi:hypothetical protein